MGLEGTGDLALHIILTKVGPEDASKVACVSKKLMVLASEESLWSKFCFEDLLLSKPLDPQGNLAPSFKVAYKLWREAFAMYPWFLVRRVKKCWDVLKNWLSINFPEVKATLCEGASEADIQELEKSLKVKLPLPTRVIYRFCDGQEFKGHDFSTSVLGSTLGLIGGYSFYDHLVNVYLLPLSQVILETKEIRRHVRSFSRSQIVVAASSTISEKLFALDCGSGQLCVGTGKFPSYGETIPCVPSELIHSYGDQQQDAMLLWLEEHGRRLQDGIIKVRQDGNFKSINLFPEKLPLCSTAVTNGVQVRASAIFVPELAKREDDSQRYLFTYSIRMSLLPDGCIINGMFFSSCQLHWRHWVIRASDRVVSDVNGEAVIGQFPLLHPGEEEFVYESCTPLPTSSGSVEGSFTFVPGRLADPKGSSFEVEVARFPLQVPDYIF